MSKQLSLILAALATTAACASNTTTTTSGVPAPTGAPRMAKGQLPMSSAMKPKTVTAIKEMAGKPAVATRATVSATGAFNLVLEVGIRYTFIITLDDGAMISLFAADAAADYYSWLPIGNSVDGAVLLDFGSVTIVNNTFISNTVLLGIDWDADGIADFSDSDDDNDGIIDIDDFDIDGDGIEDDYLDADGDGECDLADNDDDGDGTPDEDDLDDDGDGIPDDSETPTDIDIDGDGDGDGGDGGGDGGGDEEF